MSPLHVSQGEIAHFKHLCVSAGNRMATQTFTKKKKTKPSLSFDYNILMSTWTCITKKELEQEIKTKETNFAERKT